MKTILILALAILFVFPAFSQSTETGEFKRGEDWMQFFEMTLDQE